ncbi:hypothetical protein K440DRAFT_620560 [Wilcoxina mikolae CBS 423.85]|nr:hypothetical protein K440DRAFT_620560 [Wilcoxina mikolae CBS 423.85]
MSCVYNSAHNFITTVLATMVSSGFVPASRIVENNMRGFLQTQAETMVAGFRGPYRTSQARADVSIRNKRWLKNPLPGFMVEAGLVRIMNSCWRIRMFELLAGMGGCGRCC